MAVDTYVGVPPAGPPVVPPARSWGVRHRRRLVAALLAGLMLAAAAGLARTGPPTTIPSADVVLPPPTAAAGPSSGSPVRPSRNPAGVGLLGEDFLPSPGASGGRPGDATPAPRAPRRFPFPRTTLPGASIHLRGGETFAEGLARSDRTYGPLRMVRVFYPGLPPAWPRSRADESDRTVVVSFKAAPREIIAGKHDALLAAWFAGVPTGSDVYWSYFHEPENDVSAGAYSAADFRAAWRRVAGLADRAGNSRLRATLILMCWTLNPRSGRDFTDFYPGGDTVDVLGWDCYNSGGRSDRYTPPAEVFDDMIAKSKALGKPWGLAETGSVLIPGDSGERRAAWLDEMSEFLNEQRPLWVAYYDYQVSGGDFRLLDTPSQQAWRAWCAAST